MIFLSSHLPSDLVPEAGQKICLRHLLKFANKEETHLVSFVNESEKKYIDNKSFFKCATVNLFEINKLARIKNFIFNINLPVLVAIRSDQRVLSAVQRLIQEYGEDEVFIEYEQAAYVIPYLPSGVRCTVVFHDVLSQVLQRRVSACQRFSLPRLFYSWQLKKTLAWEKQLSELIHKAVVLNEKDKDLLTDLGFQSDRIEVEYPLVADSFHNATRESVDPNTILFWGAMGREENEEAVIWFVRKIYPRIKNRLPAVRFVVLGANPTPAVRRLAQEDIVITGFVEDPIPYFEEAAVAVAPLLKGAGIKLKVLEALAAKLPVVGTSVAAEGVVVGSGDLYVADTPEEFAKGVIDKLIEVGANH